MSEYQLERFFEELVGFKDFSQFTQLEFYKPLPKEWFIAITDIKGSTQAIQQGLYKEVNSISTASMIAVLNTFDSVEIPYVFGGDGATICIPPSKLDSVKSALAASRELAQKSFGLHLRVGLVPMHVIEDKNLQVLVGKYQPSEHFKQAMFHGEGLSYAETLIKNKQLDNPYLLEEDILPQGSFQGFECRWNEIPSAHEETITLMIKSLDESTEVGQNLYKDILQKIEQIYGEEKEFHPLRLTNLCLTSSLKKLLIETRIQTSCEIGFMGLKSTFYLLKLWLLTLLGRYLMAKGIKTENVDWSKYKQTFINNTDYRKFDETLRMVICGNLKQRTALITYLDKLYQSRKIVYGLHQAPSAIVTCMISDYDKKHIHFLDGANGGYAMAAKQMKQQLKEVDS